MTVKQNHYIRQSLKNANDKNETVQQLIKQMPMQYDLIIDNYILQAERANGNHSAARKANPYLTAYTAANGNRKTQYEIAEKLFHNR